MNGSVQVISWLVAVQSQSSSLSSASEEAQVCRNVGERGFLRKGLAASRDDAVQEMEDIEISLQPGNIDFALQHIP